MKKSTDMEVYDTQVNAFILRKMGLKTRFSKFYTFKTCQMGKKQ